MDIPLTQNYYKSNKSKVVISAGLKPATHSLGLMMGFEPTNDIGPQNKFVTNRLYPLAT